MDWTKHDFMFIGKTKKINQISTVIEACQRYEQIRHGHAATLGSIASIDEVLKQMGLEE